MTMMTKNLHVTQQNPLAHQLRHQKKYLSILALFKKIAEQHSSYYLSNSPLCWFLVEPQPHLILQALSLSRFISKPFKLVSPDISIINLKIQILLIKTKLNKISSEIHFIASYCQEKSRICCSSTNSNTHSIDNPGFPHFCHN